MKRSLAYFAAALLIAGAAHAQTPFPEASAAPDAKTPAPKRPTGVDTILDRPLRLNGSGGEVRFAKSESDKSLRIVELVFAGEVISDPAQRCVIRVVGDAPIEATLQDSPGIAPHYVADIPVCPLAFDVLDEAVQVPAQTTACVFKSADCQANPGGLWGPDPFELAPRVAQIRKDRSRAESAIAASLKTLDKRHKDQAQALASEQNDFVAKRDETCRAYADESTHGFCHARLTEARAAELRKLVGPEKKPKRKTSKREAPKDEAPKN